jgi:putative phosphoesterase
MKILVIADTHDIPDWVVRCIVELGQKWGVELVIHCGDIIPEHVSNELFSNLPVICAIVKNQKDDPVFGVDKPVGWTLTRSEDRVRTLTNDMVVYVGHQRPLDYLRATEEKFNAILMDLRQTFDGLRYVFGGHTHFQAYKQGQLVTLVNPGAVKDAIGWGYEYALVDTETGKVIFSRVLPTPDSREIFTVGVISDTLDITERDAKYWSLLARELKEGGVSHLIICGNMHLTDIGRSELAGLTVHYAIRSDQYSRHRAMQEGGVIPANWQVIALEDLDKGAVVDINGYRFYVQLDLGLEYMQLSEVGMDSKAMEIRRLHPETEFVLCGFTRDALLMEGEQAVTINPGDTNTDRAYVTIQLPKREITFDHVPVEALPQ